MLQVGRSPCLKYLYWSEQLRTPIYQIRFGIKTFVVVNSYDAAKFFWVDSMTSNCSRPALYTFNKVVSASQGLTIGTTPWSDTYKRKKRSTAKALNKPAVKSYLSIIDFESAVCIKGIYDEVRKSETGCIAVESHFNTFSINTSLTLGYGTRIDDLDDVSLGEIMTVEKSVGNFRSTLACNYPDYIPFLRHFPSFLSKKLSFAIDIRRRRDNYMDSLLRNLQKQLRNNTALPCIIGNILKDQDYDNSSLSKSELQSVCLTMVSAGLDTVPAILTLFIGHMSQDYGQQIQAKAWREIQQNHPDGDPWMGCLDLTAGSLSYISALVKETLRFSGMPISLPRETTRDILYSDNCVIPKGTTMILNTFAANFDPIRFYQPLKFNPDRYLKSGSSVNYAATSGPAHFSFGAGTRMCCGSLLAEKEIFTAIVRLISSFEILPPIDPADLMTCQPSQLYQNQEALMLTPPPFKVTLKPRSITNLNNWLATSLSRDNLVVIGKVK